MSHITSVPLMSITASMCTSKLAEWIWKATSMDVLWIRESGKGERILRDASCTETNPSDTRVSRSRHARACRPAAMNIIVKG